MEKSINISYPQSLAQSLKLSNRDFINEIKMSSLVKLFELGKISSGTAAKILGLSRVDFLDKTSNYKVSVFNYSDISDLNEDFLNA
jgi:predicted HTH domain antitoxin